MINNERDVRLMLEVKEDSEAALRHLYEAYRRPLCKFFYGCTYDYTLAEDCLQEVFVRLWRARKRYEPTGKFSTYIFQIAKNYWLNQKDKRDRRPKLFSIDGGRTDKDGETIRDQHESLEPGAPTHLLRSEIDERISAAIESLPEKIRLVFLMGQVQGMKYREISKILDIPEGTIKSRMSRAVRLLRDRLRSYLEEESGQSSQGRDPE